MVQRVGKDEYFLNITQEAKERSTCGRLHVGAVVVADGEIVGTGYNGAPRGAKHCTEYVNGCPLDKNGNCLNAVHAELNALLHCRSTSYRDHLTIYCTHQPCFHCCKAIVNFGITRVVYDVAGTYVDKRILELGYENQNDYLIDLGIEVSPIETPSRRVRFLQEILNDGARVYSDVYMESLSMRSEMVTFEDQLYSMTDGTKYRMPRRASAELRVIIPDVNKLNLQW